VAAAAAAQQQAADCLKLKQQTNSQYTYVYG